MADSDSDGASDKIFDVAISFLARDEGIAKQLCDGLKGLNVFFFPRSQEELAGTNGLESMRKPFFDSRIVVVLFRDPWGKTRWTMVEDTAIQERCLKHGWQGLLFVQLEKAHSYPAWVPETHVRYNMEDFGLDGLVGVIKARVLDLGGRIEPPNAYSEAVRVRREAEYLTDRDRLMRDANWIHSLRQSISRTLAAVVRLADEIAALHGMQLKAGCEPQCCVLRCDNWISMAVQWRQPCVNSVIDDQLGETFLWVKQFSGGIPTPGEHIGIVFDPILVGEYKFKVDLSQLREIVWRETGVAGVIVPGSLADRIVRLFLDFVSRANRGEIERPYA